MIIHNPSITTTGKAQTEMVQFTVIGSLNYDLVSYTSRAPERGETFRADSFETHVGGKGLNQTIALAKTISTSSKSSVRMIGHVGDDSFGSQLKGALEEFGVDTSGVKVLENQSSGVAVITVEKDTGDNRILITAGANDQSEFTPSQLESLFPLEKNEDQEVVVFQNEIPGTQSSIEWLSSNRPGVEIVYNPSPYYSTSVNLLKHTDILVVNEGEAMSIAKDILPSQEYTNFRDEIEKDDVAGYTHLSTVLQSQLSINHSQTVVITLGPIGSLYTSKDKSEFIEATKVKKVVDTTGAGDTFLGAFTTQLFTESKGNVGKALRFAALASSLAIQKNGAAESIPLYSEIVGAN